jgi:circadian clock protein KaiC
MYPERLSAPTRPSESPSIPKAPTGIRGLDVILMGGFPLDRTTILSGTAGTGKTVMAMEFLYRGALEGNPGLFVSFEERAEDIRANASAMSMDLAALEKQSKLAVISAQVPHDAISTGDFDTRGLLAMIEGHAGLMGAKRIVLDAVDSLMSIFENPRREREEISILLNRLRDLAMTTIFTVKAEPGGQKLYSFLDFMADCVLFLDQRIEGQVRTRRLNVLKYRGSDFLNNEHPYVISPEGIVLLPVSSIHPEKLSFKERVSSGNDKLDQIMGGGYIKGSCILLAGPSGIGKTSLACTFAHAACNRGEKVLFVNFENSRESLVQAMQSIGLDMMPALEGDSRLRILEAMPESLGVEEHLLRIIDEMSLFTPLHLVVDAISACRRIGSDKAVFDFLLRLMTECKARGITCFFTNQIPNQDLLTQVSGQGISSLLDTIIVMGYFFEGQKLNRRLMVIKSRGSDHSKDFYQLALTDTGVRLSSVNGHGSDTLAPDRRI